MKCNEDQFDICLYTISYNSSLVILPSPFLSYNFKKSITYSYLIALSIP